jgi:hypothetical protein
MQTISKKISILSILANIFLAAPANANDEILLLSSHDSQIAVKMQNHRLVAKEVRKNLNYQVSNALSNHLVRAYDVRLISDKSDQNGPLFIVLSREPSRPNSMGRGYCGAGYEEYLLLIEISREKIELRDQFLLQSCLKSIAMVIDNGDDLDDAGNGLILNSDGSFSYRLLEDEASQERNLVLRDRRFKISLVPAQNHPAPE